MGRDIYGVTVDWREGLSEEGKVTSKLWEQLGLDMKHFYIA